MKTRLFLLLTGLLAASGVAANDFHPQISELDSAGRPLADSAAELSLMQTCGACHDYDQISNAYHFQQGRTDVNGNIIMQDDYFGDHRPWLKSPGMYGKW